MVFNKKHENPVDSTAVYESDAHALRQSIAEKKHSNDVIKHINKERRNTLDNITRQQNDMLKHFSKIKDRKDEITREKFDAQRMHGNRHYTKSAEQVDMSLEMSNSHKMCLPMDKAKALLRTVLPDPRAQKAMMLRKQQELEYNNPDHIGNIACKYSYLDQDDDDGYVYEDAVLHHEQEVVNNSQYVPSMFMTDVGYTNDAGPGILKRHEGVEEKTAESCFTVVHSHVPHMLPAAKHADKNKHHVHFDDSAIVEINTMPDETESLCYTDGANTDDHLVSGHSYDGIDTTYATPSFSQPEAAPLLSKSLYSYGKHATDNAEHLPPMTERRATAKPKQEITVIVTEYENEPAGATPVFHEDQPYQSKGRRNSTSLPGSPDVGAFGHRRRSLTWPKKPSDFDELRMRVLKKKNMAVTPEGSEETLDAISVTSSMFSQQSQQGMVSPRRVPPLSNPPKPPSLDSLDSSSQSINDLEKAGVSYSRRHARRSSLAVNHLPSYKSNRLTQQEETLSSSQNYMLNNSSESLSEAKSAKAKEQWSRSFNTLSIYYNTIKQFKQVGDHDSSNERLSSNERIDAGKQPGAHASKSTKGTGSEMHKWLGLSSKKELRKMQKPTIKK